MVLPRMRDRARSTLTGSRLEVDHSVLGQRKAEGKAVRKQSDEVRLISTIAGERLASVVEKQVVRGMV